MTTPSPPTDINIGDTWALTLSGGLGTGIGAIPEGALVTITNILPPYSPGVGQTSEYTIECEYDYTDVTIDANGNEIDTPDSRILALPESIFRTLFAPETEGGE